MPIYTKTGDKGKTSLFDGKRIAKDDLRVEAYASADELTTYIGFASSLVKDKKDKNLLLSIQKDLYIIMSYLAGSKVPIAYLGREVKSFERIIDFESSKLSKLNRFILPSGKELGSRFHLARIACRSSERSVISALKKYGKVRRSEILLNIIPYLNRLSDLFFTYARKYNKGREYVT